MEQLNQYWFSFVPPAEWRCEFCSQSASVQDPSHAGERDISILSNAHYSFLQSDEITEDMVQPMILEDNTDEELPLNEHDNDTDDMSEGGGRNKRSKASNDVATHSRLLDSHIKIALSLYKVQQNIYLLDFQRIEASLF